MIQSPKGLNDSLPQMSAKLVYVESVFREICRKSGFKEIRTPLFEYTKLFQRGVGESTDIVNKEMFSVVPSVDLRELRTGAKTQEDFFKRIDREGYTLKPEGTAPVVRAFIEAKLYADSQPTKLYYITPCFRHERHQAGRYRQFTQFGIETFGSKEPSSDAEVIALGYDFISGLGIKDFILKINSIGCPNCKPAYNEKLKNYLMNKSSQLCATCNDRIDKNPMRVIDCKTPKCQENITDIPFMLDNLCDECESHFSSVKTYLDSMEIPYIVDPKIVRGLDYYSKTAFEFVSDLLGAQSTVCGGGRYDGLVEDVEGPSTPGVGFGMGVERLMIMLEASGVEIPVDDRLDCFIASLGSQVQPHCIGLLTKLRRGGLNCDMDHLSRSLKAQFKYADKVGAKNVITIGEDEVEKGIIKIKNMSTGEQTEYSLSDAAGIINQVRSNG